MDLQRQRLRHLVANAILELWKKETGSLSSVLIEGTVCITSGSGKTTVVQVSDKFCGSIPEWDASLTMQKPGAEPGLRISTPRQKMLPPDFHFSPQTPASRYDYRNSQQALTAYFDHLSPASMISPNTEPSRERSPSVASSRPEKRARSEQSGREQSVEDTVKDVMMDIKEEILSDNEEDSAVENQSLGSGGVVAGTGYYACGSPDVNQNHGSKTNLNLTADESGIGSSIDCTPKVLRAASTPLHLKDRDVSSENPSTPVASRDLDALDLTRLKDNDLAISPPQSYTAQVRNVIRQRLAAKAGSLAVGDDRDVKTPNMLQSLGLHRSTGNEEETTENENVSGGALNLMQRAGSLHTLVNRINMQQRQETANGGPLHDILRRKPQVAVPPPLVRPSPYPSLSSFHDGLPTMIAPQSALSQMSYSIMQIGRPNQGSSQNMDSDDTSSGKASPSSVNGEQKIYRCEFCTKTFLFKSKYHEHLPVHTNARPFQCHLCSRTYKYKYDLRVHLRTHMGIPTKSTLCPFCNVKFDSNKILRQHIKDAHHEKYVEVDLTSGENLPPAWSRSSTPSLEAPSQKVLKLDISSMPAFPGSPSPAASPATPMQEKKPGMEDLPALVDKVAPTL